MKKVSLLALLAFGCGEDEGEGATETEGMQLSTCTYDFTVDIREGPNAGTQLKGTLALGRDPEGFLYGRMTPPGSTESMLVTGHQKNNEIKLFFWFANGDTIIGTGPHGGNAGTCQAEIEGDLVGVVEGDTGDWIGLSLADQPIEQCLTGCTFVPTDVDACKQMCAELIHGIQGSIIGNVRTGGDGVNCEASCRSSLGTLDCSEGNTFGGCE